MHLLNRLFSFSPLVRLAAFYLFCVYLVTHSSRYIIPYSVSLVADLHVYISPPALEYVRLTTTMFLGIQAHGDLGVRVGMDRGLGMRRCLNGCRCLLRRMRWLLLDRRSRWSGGIEEGVDGVGCICLRKTGRQGRREG